MMAALVVYGGAGINLISYCCNLCRMEGIEAVILDKCCDIHHHNHSDKKIHHPTSGCCEHTCDVHNGGALHPCCDIHEEYSSADCCSLERVSFDWCIQNLPEQEIDISPLILDFSACNMLAITYLENITTGEKHTPASHGPPIALPRDYLSILTVLLI